MSENVPIYVALAAGPPYRSWINHCAFLARCVSSGLLNRCEYSLYSLREFSKGPQRDHAVEIIRKYSLTVVAKYFELAGSKIYKELVENPQCMLERHKGMQRWRLWEKRLKEVGDSKNAGYELGCHTRYAHEKMRSIRRASYAILNN